PDYGTGAIMAVPAHDTRDLAFARKYNLPIIQVVAKENELTRSYLMGAPAITDADLISLGIQIAEKKADGDRKLLIPKKSLPLYEELISEEISKGFWNEYVGEEIVFIFKDKKGKVSRFALSPDNEEQIDKLAAEYVGEKWNKKGVWNWLAENEWYQDLILHHDKGHLVNSGIFSKLPSDKAAVAITKAIRGKLTTKYKLRDWVFSRQRYWGEPIPVIHCPVCATVVPVPEKDLPVLLPKVKSYAPTGTGESPLADIAKWVNVKCPVCGSKAKRETNTMPQWAGSSWYYLRYIDPDNNKKLADTKKLDYWLGTGLPRSESSSRDSATGVDLYVGGTEHTTRHLIYARFWHKFLQDIGVVNCSEPFKQLKNQGMILGADNRKMSKRWGNVVNPDDVVKNYGADTLRVYEMFMGPFEQGASWNTNNMIGSRRFVERVWRLSEKVIARPGLAGKINPDLEILFNKTIKKVGEDIENFSFNTAISALMILTNALEKEEKISPEYWQDLLLIFAPFAPHVAEELWQKSGHQKSIISEKWPSFDSQKLVSEKIKIVIQVNGKVRGEVEISGEMGEAEIVKIANGTESIKKWLNNEKVKKTIYIKGKLLNFVI
ncbi:MAG: class I tRNA ligase family protein, partial [Candidatus Vogelbacteria bacterium]|nr:class I tRNA ligase family protein [Candidatus Vogelbacteria bacterium]